MSARGVSSAVGCFLEDGGGAGWAASVDFLTHCVWLWVFFGAWVDGGKEGGWREGRG
jgi:hypothetical protein